MRSSSSLTTLLARVVVCNGLRRGVSEAMREGSAAIGEGV